MAIPATQLRPGMIIKHNNDLHSVFSVEHRTPGNLRAFIQAKLRNLRTGAMFEHRFRSPDPIERINVDEVEMQYLYNDGDSYYFMDTGMPSQVFDVPHLIDVAGGPPFLHNGAAATLEEIWTKFNMVNRHGATHDLTREQLNDLVAYLKAL